VGFDRSRRSETSRNAPGQSPYSQLGRLDRSRLVSTVLAAGGALPFTDNFNRASLGAGWVAQSNWSWGILASSAVRSTLAGSAPVGVLATTTADHPPVADCSAQCSPTGGGIGPMVRWVANGVTIGDFIYLSWDGASGIAIYEYVAGVGTFLGGTSSAPIGTVFKLEAVGTTVKAYLDGVLQATVTTSVVAAGQTGLVAELSGVTADDFTADVATSSGSNVAAAITEAAGATDTPDAIATQLASITEAATALDATDATLTTSASRTEAAAAADTPDATALRPASITEAAAALDAQTATVTTSASITEAANATDIQSATALALASRTEAANATDAPDASQGFGSTAAEAADAQQAVDAIVLAVASRTEAASATDTPDAIATQLASRTEAAAATDAPDATIARLAGAVEAASAADSPDAQLITSASIAEAAGALDTVDATIQPPGINVAASATEAAAATDASDATIAIAQVGGGGGWRPITPLFQPALGFEVAAAHLERARAIDACDAFILRAVHARPGPITPERPPERRRPTGLAFTEDEIVELVALLAAADIA
jgi:hypothetical protein